MAVGDLVSWSRPPQTLLVSPHPGIGTEAQSTPHQQHPYQSLLPLINYATAGVSFLQPRMLHPCLPSHRNMQVHAENGNQLKARICTNEGPLSECHYECRASEANHPVAVGSLIGILSMIRQQIPLI